MLANIDILVIHSLVKECIIGDLCSADMQKANNLADNIPGRRSDK